MTNAIKIATVAACAAALAFAATLATARHSYMTACQSSGMITADECAQLWSLDMTGKKFENNP